ncbi:hypothetical protein CC86DRAFT_369117 [Ophiobolus disseminans]|uniref:Opioid growth factor receptor (OGFr) conserved domain-containing protein n=1 Tax=Ophiobolus disseminans TaxID=1469910 RepID=A0A6A7A562_9PLEO|nr:hypothetical protein CC86DRAFT_369117 [Ophiobolus disseminans]
MSLKRFKFPGMTSTPPSKTASKTPLIVRFYDPDVQARDAHDRKQEHILSWPDSQLERCHNYIQMLFPVPEGSAFNWEAPIIDRETMDAFRSRSELRSRLRWSFERMLDFYGFEVKLQPEETEAKEVEAADDPVAGSVEDKKEGAEDALPDTKSSPEVAPESNTEEAITDEGKGKEPESKDATKEEPAEQSSATTVPPSAHTKTAASCGYDVVRSSHWAKSFKGWAVRFDHNHLRITRILRCLRILGLQTECDAFFAALKEVYEDPAFKISERSMSYWTRAVTRPLYIAPDDERIDWLREWEREQEALKASEEDAKVEKKGEEDRAEIEADKEAEAKKEL